jgi:hypothetical protein
MKTPVKAKKESVSINKEIAEILKEAELWKEKYYVLLEKHTALLNEGCKRKNKRK